MERRSTVSRIVSLGVCSLAIQLNFVPIGVTNIDGQASIQLHCLLGKPLPSSRPPCPLGGLWWDAQGEMLAAADAILCEQRKPLLADSKPSLLWTSRKKWKPDYVLIEGDRATQIFHLERDFFDS